MGYVYIIQPIPEHDPNRVKIGYSESSPIDRLKECLRWSPNARFVRQYHVSERSYEQIALAGVEQFCKCERVATEAFDSQDYRDVVRYCDKLFRVLPGVELVGIDIESDELQVMVSKANEPRWKAAWIDRKSGRPKGGMWQFRHNGRYVTLTDFGAPTTCTGENGTDTERQLAIDARNRYLAEYWCPPMPKKYAHNKLPAELPKTPVKCRQKRSKLGRFENGVSE